MSITIGFFPHKIMRNLYEGVVLHRLYLLWNFDRVGKLILIGSFILSKVNTLAFSYASSAIVKGIYASYPDCFNILMHIQDSIVFEGDGSLRVCAITETPLLYLGSWAPAVNTSCTIVYSTFY